MLDLHRRNEALLSLTVCRGADLIFGRCAGDGNEHIYLGASAKVRADFSLFKFVPSIFFFYRRMSALLTTTHLVYIKQKQINNVFSSLLYSATLLFSTLLLFSSLLYYSSISLLLPSLSAPLLSLRLSVWCDAVSTSSY